MVDFTKLLKDRKMERRKLTPLCSVCNEPQRSTSSGMVCKNGHGGDDGVEVPDLAEAQELPLHLKYRPTVLKDVWGQDQVTDSLQDVISSKSPGHAYLFTGPAGTGKTTLARILASRFHCDANSVVEVDAASNSGIDAMREVTGALRYQGFGATPNKAIIIDECHGLSKQAWDSLLKTVEEPPPHVYIFFCTTVPGKVPATIVTRCHSYTLKPLKRDDIFDLLTFVCHEEKLDLAPGVMDLIVGACDGSARQALVMLSMVRGCRDEDEAAALLESPADNKDVIDLCRLLVGGKLTWPKLIETLKAIPDMNPESVRIVMTNYLGACLMGAKSDKDAMRLLDLAACFSKPFNPTDKQVPLLLAFGNIIFPE